MRMKNSGSKKFLQWPIRWQMATSMIVLFLGVLCLNPKMGEQLPTWINNCTGLFLWWTIELSQGVQARCYLASCACIVMWYWRGSVHGWWLHYMSAHLLHYIQQQNFGPNLHYFLHLIWYMPKTALLVSLMQAISVGLEILHQLGFTLSQNVTALRILYEFMRTNALIHSCSFDLCNLPMLQDNTAIYTERIFDALATGTYTIKSDFFPLLTLLHIQMCIWRVVGTYSPFAFATYGIIAGAKLGKLGKGYKMGQVAKHLLNRLPHKASTSRTIFLIHQFLSHW
jgi:hypothetical protein